MKKWLVFLSPLIALALFAGACVNTPQTAPSAGGGGTTPLASSYLIPPVSSQQTGLWVNGQGKVTYTPDMAVLTLGIQAQEKTVARAQSEARDAMNKVTAALKAKNVADKDIRTQSFSIQPVIQYVEVGPAPAPMPPGYKPPPNQVIVGYIVSNTVVVKVRKIDDAGPIIDAVAEAGGDFTRINNIGFTVDDFTPLLNQARDNAVKDALARAKQIAADAGVTLGKPVYINEGGSYVPSPEVRNFAAPMAAGAAPTSISPGEQQLTDSVQMVFEIK